MTKTDKNNFSAFFKVLMVMGLAGIIYFGGQAYTAVGCWFDWGGATMDWRTRGWTCQVQHPTMGWIPANKIRGTE